MTDRGFTIRAAHYDRAVAALKADPIIIDMAGGLREYNARGGTVGTHIGGPAEALLALLHGRRHRMTRRERPVVRFPNYTVLADGEDGYSELPAHYEVCDRCRGEGTHTNPNIDGNGITAEEMDELGDDFRDDYLRGVYDVRCEECGGNRVVPVVDRTAADPALLAEYDEWVADERDYRAECAAERRAFGY